MIEPKIWIGISKKEVEQLIEEEVKQYAKKLISYDYVKNVFYNELRLFARSKIKTKGKNGTKKV